MTIRERIHIENDMPSGDGKKPLALDLDRDGLEFQGIDDSDIVADMNGDDVLDRMSWIGGDDGLLTLDRDGDGRVSGFDEISFVDDDADARTDLEGLRRAHDSNEDGLLDARDAGWSAFAVWQDRDGDGVEDAGERQSLEDAGIRSIHLVADRVYQHVDDVSLFGTTTYAHADGTQHAVGDVAFHYRSTGESAATGPLPLSTNAGEDGAASAAPAPDAGEEVQASGEPSAMTADEAAAMLVQRMVQAQALAPGTGGDTSAMVDAAAIAAAQGADADELEMATVAG
ncbi:MAG: hypothetical protein U5K43_08350 [Halofilum sp. (in: g-proteobacteria)]|nr:hypothetical protein [Halofilum sp. (in: g-proteobacteria)]